MIGKTILNYNIVSLIGSGGMGEVYLAEHVSIQQKVAIKVLLPSLVNNKEIHDRFRNEAQSMENLAHPNIVGFKHYHEDETGFYLIMEYVDGRPLDELIKKETGPIEHNRAVHLMLQVLDACGFAHKQGIVHRDIKPGNILVRADDSIKILDFGIAKIMGKGGHSLTKTGAQMGTVYYMSPEQVEGHAADHFSDIYSLGITFFQMLTGSNPYSSITTEYEIYNSIVKVPLPNPCDLQPGIPDYLGKIVLKATAKNKQDRFENCERFAAALRDKVGPIGIPEPKVRMDPKIKKGAVIGGGIMALIGLIFLLINLSWGGGQMEANLFPFIIDDEVCYVNREGKMTINPQYSMASMHYEGLALVGTLSDEATKYGFIDEKGNYSIAPIYDDASSFSEGIAWVVSPDSKPKAIDSKGKDLFTVDAERVYIFKEGRAHFKKTDPQTGENLWGYFNSKGEIEIQPRYIDADFFSNGLAVVQLPYDDEGEGGEYVYINKDGEQAFSDRFAEASRFKNGMAVVRSGEKHGVISTSGQFLIAPTYENDLLIDGDWILFKLKDKVGWMDRDGKVVINPQFDDADLFGNSDLAPVQMGEKYGFIDRTGTLKINPTFDGALPFNGDLAVVLQDDKLGLISKEGKYIVNPTYDGISMDLEAFVKNNPSRYDNVLSDYFDAENIVSSLDFQNPIDWVSVSSTTYGAIKEKLDLEESDFSKNHSAKTPLRSYFNLSPDVYYSLYAYGNPFKTSYGQEWRDSWWGGGYYETTTRYTFTDSWKPDSYFFELTLNDVKGSRAVDLMDELLKQVKARGYSSDSEYEHLEGHVLRSSQGWVWIQETTNNSDRLVLNISFGRNT